MPKSVWKGVSSRHVRRLISQAVRNANLTVSNEAGIASSSSGIGANSHDPAVNVPNSPKNGECSFNTLVCESVITAENVRDDNCGQVRSVDTENESYAQSEQQGELEFFVQPSSTVSASIGSPQEPFTDAPKETTSSACSEFDTSFSDLNDPFVGVDEPTDALSFPPDVDFDDFLCAWENCARCSMCACLLGPCSHIEFSCSHCDKCLKIFNDGDESKGNSSDSEDSVVCETTFQDSLATWASDHNINHTQLRSLLSVLRHYGHNDLPKDPRTVLQTPRSTTIRPVPPGEYWHKGLKKQLEALYIHSDVTEIRLSFNIDGLPLAQSSASTLWPILCSTPEFSVLLVGLYHGYSKPDSANMFLEEMVDEVRSLCTDGLIVDERIIAVKVKNFICDSPAKSFALNITSFNGYFGCCKCEEIGEMRNRRMCFSELNARVRTDEGFVQHICKDHHQGSTVLEQIANFGLVSGFVLDYMHLLCLGVMKKLLLFWLCGSLNVRASPLIRVQISKSLHDMSNCLPKEFVRTPRELLWVRKYKATEFRQILLYTGPVILRFLTLHVACSILANPDTCIKYNDCAKQLMQHFVTTFIILYGKEYVSHNIHNLTHICDDVILHGCLDDFSAFPFENYMQTFKKYMRKAEKPLQQIARRHSEVESAKCI